MGARSPITYSYEALAPERADAARRVAASIRGRSAREVEARQAWLYHGLDLVHGYRVVPHGGWEAWVRAEAGLQPRTAENYRRAAETVIKAHGSENFSDLPVLPRSVIYRLARDGTPEDIRDRFLRRILEGGKVSMREVEEALRPDDADDAGQPYDAPDPGARPIREPGPQATALAEAIDEAQAHALLDELRQGRADELARALEWRLAAAASRCGRDGDCPSDGGPGATAAEPRDDVIEVGDNPGAAVLGDDEPAPEMDPGPRPGGSHSLVLDPWLLDAGYIPVGDLNEPSPEPESVPNATAGEEAVADPADAERRDGLGARHGDDPGARPRGSLNREAAIARIRALRAKTTANGCTEAEALAAAMKAGELLDRYALSLSDLEIGQTSCEQRAATDRRHDVDLVSNAIARFTGCRTWVDGVRVQYFGLPHDVEVAQFLTDLCRGAMDASFRAFLREHRHEGVDGRKARKSFMVAMANRLSERLDALAAQRQETAQTGSGSSLTVVRDAAVERQYADLGLNLRNARTRSFQHDFFAYRAGAEAAERVRIVTGIREEDRDLVLC